MLREFLIFNPSEIKNNGKKGGGEDETDLMEQILFHHSSGATTSTTGDKVKLMGLAQTLNSFVMYFNKDLEGGSSGQDEDGMVWKTAGGSKAILKRVEGEYWMLLKMAVESATTATTSKSKVSCDDQFLRWLVQNTYDRFKLFHHSFFRVRVDSLSKDAFKSCLESHFGPCMQVLESACLYPSLQIIENGIQVAPFPNEAMYRKTITCCTRLLTSIPLKRGKCMLLWKETLCWSSLDSHLDTKILYDYLINESTGLYPDQILNQVKGKGESAITLRAYPSIIPPLPSSASFTKATSKGGGGMLRPLESFFRRPSKQDTPFSGFLVGPDINSYPQTIQDCQVQPKIIYLQGQGGGINNASNSPSSSTPHIFVVYQFKDDYTLCLFSPIIESSQFTSLHWYKTLQSTILQALEPLDKMLLENREEMDNCLRIPDRSFCFLTLNQTDLVLQKGLKTKSHPAIGADLLDTLAQVRIDLERQPPGDGAGKEGSREILIEAANQGRRVWICAMYSSPRLTIVILHAQDSSDLPFPRIQDEINFIKASILTSLSYS